MSTTPVPSINIPGDRGEKKTPTTSSAGKTAGKKPRRRKKKRTSVHVDDSRDRIIAKRRTSDPEIASPRVIVPENRRKKSPKGGTAWISKGPSARLRSATLAVTDDDSPAVQKARSMSTRFDNSPIDLKQLAHQTESPNLTGAGGSLYDSGGSLPLYIGAGVMHSSPVASRKSRGFVASSSSNDDYDDDGDASGESSMELSSRDIRDTKLNDRDKQFLEKMMGNHDFQIVGLLFECVSFCMDEWDVLVESAVGVFSARNRGREIQRFVVQKEILSLASFQKIHQERSEEGARLETCATRSFFWSGLAMLREIAKNSLPSSTRQALCNISATCGSRFQQIPNPDAFAISFFFLHVLTPCVADPHGAKMQKYKPSLKEIRHSARIARWIQNVVNVWGQQQISPEGSPTKEQSLETAEPKVTQAIQLMNIIGATMVAPITKEERNSEVDTPASPRSINALESQLGALLGNYKSTIVMLMHCKEDRKLRQEILVTKFGKAAERRVFSRTINRDEFDVRSSRISRLPEKLRRFFVPAERAVDRQFEDFVATRARGSVTVAGERYLLLPALAMSKHIQAIGTKLRLDPSALPAFEYGVFHEVARQDCQRFVALISAEHRDVSLKRQQVAAGVVAQLAFLGWARLTVEEDKTKFHSNGGISMVLTASYSFEAHCESRKRVIGGHACVCHKLRGYLSGWMTYALTGEGGPRVAAVAAAEIICTGEDGCTFLIDTPDTITGKGAKLAEALKAKVASACILGALVGPLATDMYDFAVQALHPNNQIPLVEKRTTKATGRLSLKLKSKDIPEFSESKEYCELSLSEKAQADNVETWKLDTIPWEAQLSMRKVHRFVLVHASSFGVGLASVVGSGLFNGDRNEMDRRTLMTTHQSEKINVADRQGGFNWIVGAGYKRALGFSVGHEALNVLLSDSSVPRTCAAQISALEAWFSVSGLGVLSIGRLSLISSEEDASYQFFLDNSVEKSYPFHPNCQLAAGVLAGWTTAMTADGNNHTMYCLEVSCVSDGADRCSFLCASHELIRNYANVHYNASGTIDKWLEYRKLILNPRFNDLAQGQLSPHATSPKGRVSPKANSKSPKRPNSPKLVRRKSMARFRGGLTHQRSFDDLKLSRFSQGQLTSAEEPVKEKPRKLKRALSKLGNTLSRNAGTEILKELAEMDQVHQGAGKTSDSAEVSQSADDTSERSGDGKE